MYEMDDKVINNNHKPETLSLTDFPLTQAHDRDHPNPTSSSAAGNFFEFSSGGLSEEKVMAHAEDIIFRGKLVPINEQRKNQPQQSENHHRKNQQNQHVGCRRSRSDSMSHVKRTKASPLNSRSLDYKKLNRDSSMSSELGPEIKREGSGNKASTSSRWYVFLFGLVKVPPLEMALKDMKSRQVRRTTSMASFGPMESCDVGSVNGSNDNQKCSWKVLGFLSCKLSAAQDVVMTTLPYMPNV